MKDSSSSSCFTDSSSFSVPNTFIGIVLLNSKIRSSSSCNNNTLLYTRSQLLRDFAAREFNAFLWIFLLGITFLLLRRLFNVFALLYKARTVPGPPASSFFGHFKLLSKENFTDVLSKSHEKYGPIVKLWLGPTKLLVSVKDPVLIQEMLVKTEDKLPFTGKAFHLAFGQSSLFSPSYEKVQRRRELLATELNERLMKTADLNPSKVADFIVDRIENIRVRGSISCGLVSQHMAFTLMATSFFGDGFLTWPKAAIYEELLMMIAKDACFWASYNVTPFWKQGFWRYRRACKKLRCLTEEILHSRKCCKILDRVDQNIHSESSNPETKSAYDQQTSKEESYGNIMRVTLHGSQTTAALIANVLTNLIMHPEIQDKVYSEISMVGRNPSKYEHEDVYRMPLLLATIYESARLLPTCSMLQRCSIKQDLKFGTGVTVPAGAVLVVPVQLVQKDDFNWGKDASDFNPYRFLSNVTEGSGSEEQHDYGISSFVLNDPSENAAFLPFGSGARSCAGQKFVIQVVATLLASLLKKYQIRFNSGSNGDDSEPLKNLLLHHHPNSQILFVRRDQ
ncbi:cytochrome P450 81F1-like [Vicia villosa]|uniref:cytochrome P450 81F1-like n=1 Tax=Vicia villosa TaxID=3911 RepID=UPI00273AD0A4|nr:cytochrome P450 81F1-like [Vicia villosa]